MSRELDLIILGGGCAGLSLAAKLGKLGDAAPRTLVIDKRSSYQNDRTWCFWQLPGSEALDLVEHRWTRFQVSSYQRIVWADCSGQPYCAIPSSRFYEHSLSAIKQSPRVSLLGGVSVHGGVHRKDSMWEVQTPNGAFSAKCVVDTRPIRAPRAGDAVLWQTFLGAEVEFAEGSFDSRGVTLMDFRKSPSGRIVFTYVLPFSSTRGLVEVTEFSPFAMPPADLQPLLHSALATIACGSCYKTLRTEAGALPMGLALPVSPAAMPEVLDRSYVRAGVAGGGARAATGYAFQRIQRWATCCADSLVANGMPIGHPAEPSSLALLDHLFLRVLRENPNQASTLFTQLFASAPTPSVLRFLGDRPGIADVLNVVGALPPGPFIKELASVCRGRANSWRESLAS